MYGFFVFCIFFFRVRYLRSTTFFYYRSNERRNHIMCTYNRNPDKNSNAPFIKIAYPTQCNSGIFFTNYFYYFLYPYSVIRPTLLRHSQSSIFIEYHKISYTNKFRVKKKKLNNRCNVSTGFPLKNKIINKNGWILLLDIASNLYTVYRLIASSMNLRPSRRCFRVRWFFLLRLATGRIAHGHDFRVEIWMVEQFWINNRKRAGEQDEAWVYFL